MAYSISLMREEDIAQVAEIDREAFPDMWPPTDYRRELKSRLAHYIAACDDERPVEKPKTETAGDEKPAGLVSRLRWHFLHGYRPDYEPPPASRYIVGFAGFWLMAGEAHIISLAVRQSYRRRGIGELLLVSLINLAAVLDAHLVTLEVRASNTGAQSLYGKQGFVIKGLRRGYYSDNREDAVVMTLDDVASGQYRARLSHLREALPRQACLR